VNIERWNGNAMRVRDPGTFSGPAPASIRDVLEIVLGRNCAREFDRPIKPDAHPRAADEREQRRTDLAMHVDHQIVFRVPDLFEQIKKAQRSAPSLAGLGEFASGEENHIRERGMMTDDFRILRRDQPVNAGTRIARTQFYQHRDRMHDVAERRWFDQQNARELGSLKPEAVPVLNLCVLDLPVQFAKDKSARVMPLVKLRSATRSGHVFLFA
jgi:hypothetical protein